MRTYAKHKQDFKMKSYITKLSFSARQTVSTGTVIKYDQGWGGRYLDGG